MNTRDVLQELQSLGSEQNRKVYPRHGVSGPLYGVSYADLYKLQKKIGADQPLAVELWQSGVHDARVLATMVADPVQCKARLLDAWLRNVDNYILAGALAAVAAASPLARRCAQRWGARKNEWAAATGWNIIAELCVQGGVFTDGELEAYLQEIEDRIHAVPNRARHSMNNALIAIGLCNDRVEKKALAAAKRIGKVAVDHGQTSCKTPDATAYIKKATARKKARA